MKPFKWMFEEQNATEIEYKGKQVSALYRYDKKGKYRLKFTFVSTNSQHEQSIILHLYDLFFDTLLLYLCNPDCLFLITIQLTACHTTDMHCQIPGFRILQGTANGLSNLFTDLFCHSKLFRVLDTHIII